MFHRFAVFLLTPVCPSINKYRNHVICVDISKAGRSL
jgi:hypothetical protein